VGVVFMLQSHLHLPIPTPTPKHLKFSFELTCVDLEHIDDLTLLVFKEPLTCPFLIANIFLHVNQFSNEFFAMY
jgi:hypothetical protein